MKIVLVNELRDENNYEVYGTYQESTRTICIKRSLRLKHKWYMLKHELGHWLIYRLVKGVKTRIYINYWWDITYIVFTRNRSHIKEAGLERYFARVSGKYVGDYQNAT